MREVGVMRVVMLLIIFVNMIISSVYSKTIYTGKEDVSLINTIETKHCFVSYVLINGKTYLLKQKKDYKKQLAVVRDALAAYIAKVLRDIAHEVDIVESTQEFFGKIKSRWPATLHNLASGETVKKKSKFKYNALRLRQWVPDQSLNERGLTKTIIEYMTWHRQLPIIIALDLFTGNGDRHCGNLCYDPNTDRFCAIDMDDTFNKDLCELAYKNLKQMIQKEHVVFNVEEIRALTHMRNILRFLVQKHNPNVLTQKLRFFARKAGFIQGSELYDVRIERKLVSYEKMIIKTHKSAYQLIALLDKIIDNQL